MLYGDSERLYANVRIALSTSKFKVHPLQYHHVNISYQDLPLCPFQPDFDIDDQSGGLYSYTNQFPPKAYAVLENCDHNSMLDVDLTYASNMDQSTLSRDEQVRRTFQVMVKFLEVIGVDRGNGGHGHTVNHFCSLLSKGKIVECFSEE